MKPRFDVLKEPWIPVANMSGETYELGILDALGRAHELRSVHDISPLVEYSVYRFLVVFLMDALRPRKLSDIEEILGGGSFDMDAICSYVKRCKDEGVSFDLFDEERPFMQTKVDPRWDKQTKPVDTLDYTVPSGNNHVHFDHKNGAEAYSAAKAMRMLLAAQQFCTSGAQGYPSNVNGAPPWFALIRMDSLFETLALNMIPVNQIRIKLDDPPVAWRSTAEVEPKKQVSQTSWLYGMLFPARRIHLNPGADGRVKSIYLSQGMNYIDPETWPEPHAAYRVDNKGRFNLKPSTAFAVWQNLIYFVDTQRNCAPQTLGNFARIFDEGFANLTMYGVATNQASYLQTAKRDLRLPVGIIGSDEAERFIIAFAEAAQQLSKAVREALKHKEIPEESRKSAVQRFNDRSDAKLFSLLDELCSPDAGLSALLKATVEELFKDASSCIDEQLNSLALRGRTMLETADKRRLELNKAGKAIRKRWENE